MTGDGFGRFMYQYQELTLFLIVQCARSALMKRGRAAAILDEVQTAVKRWPEFAAAAGVPDEWRDKIQKTHRLTFPKA